MAEKDEKLTELDSMFDANNPDDMDEFMKMLDSIDVDDGNLMQDLEESDTQDLENQLEQMVDSQEENTDPIPDDFMEMSADEADASDNGIPDMMSELGLSGLDSLEEQPIETDLSDGTSFVPEETPLDDLTSFVPEEDDNILDLLDSVGNDAELQQDNRSPEEIADANVEELADLFASLEGEMTDPDVDAAPVSATAEKKGFFQRLLERFRKPPTEEELLARQQEEEEERQWEESKKAQAEEKKQEAQAKKQEKQAEAEKKKQEKADKKASEKAAKAEKQAEKKAQKEAAKGPIPKSQLVPVKPLIVFVVLGIAVSVVAVLFTNYRFYNYSIRESKEQFIHQKYREAYEKLLGLDIKKKDETFYEQVKVIRMVDKDLDAYYNYIDVADYEMALDSLIQGMGKYSLQEENAKELKLEKEMYALYEEMLKELTVRFGLTAQDAMNLYESKDKEDYDKQVAQFARDAAIKDGVIEPIEITAVEK